MHKTIIDRSVLYADECSSYPSTAFALGVEHCWVNHCVWFRGDNGTRTNTMGDLENMKNSMRKEHGINLNHVDDWLIKYTFNGRHEINKSN